MRQPSIRLISVNLMCLGDIPTFAMDNTLVDYPDSLPTDGNIEQHVESRLFQNTIDSLEAHIDRKKAVADTLRFSILYVLYKFGELQRKQLTRATGKNSNGLQHHLRDLIDGSLINQIPAPDDEDGRLTYYRITTLGKQEIEADIHNITGKRTSLAREDPDEEPSGVEPRPGLGTDKRQRVGSHLLEVKI